MTKMLFLDWTTGAFKLSKYHTVSGREPGEKQVRWLWLIPKTLVNKTGKFRLYRNFMCRKDSNP